MAKKYSTEHGDLFLLQDRTDLAYNLGGTNFSLHPTPWYIAGEPIAKGNVVSIATAEWAVEELGSGHELDAGKVFASEQSNVDKCVGISLNGAVYGETVEVLDRGLYSWNTSSLLIATISSTTNGTITINGYQLTSTGSTGTAAQIATNIATVWTALSATIKKGYTVVASGATIEISHPNALNGYPTVHATSDTITLDTVLVPPNGYFYANRVTTIVTTSSAETNRTVLINGISSSATISGANSTAVATAIAGLTVTGYTLANPSAGIVTITTTYATASLVPTLLVGGTAALQFTKFSSTYKTTTFQPSDIGNTAFISAYTDEPTVTAFLVNTTASETTKAFSFNGTNYGSLSTTGGNTEVYSSQIATAIAGTAITNYTLTLPVSNTVGSVTANSVVVSNPISILVPQTGKLVITHTAVDYAFTYTSWSGSTYYGITPDPVSIGIAGSDAIVGELVLITGNDSTRTITSIGLGTLVNTTFSTTYTDMLPAQQFTTDRSLSVATGAPLIEIGIVKDLNTVFIDFEGDARGAVNLTQISAVAGEPLANEGTPAAVSIGTDGQAYLADKRKSAGTGVPNRNNVAGLLVGASGGYWDYQSNTVGSVGASTITIATGNIDASTPAAGSISVTHGGVVYNYTYTGYATNQYTGVSPNPTTTPAVGLSAGDVIWGGTVPTGTSIVIQKAGLTSGFPTFSASSIGSALYADINGGITSNIDAFSFYTDVVNPLGFVTTTDSVYVEMGFNTQRTDTGTIGSIYWMSTGATYADYGAVPCTTGLTITGNTGVQAGHLNAVGTTVISAGTGIQAGTYDFTSLYGQIGTMYAGYTVWVVSNYSAAAGVAILNGTSYAIGAPSSDNDLAAKIATAIGTVGGYTCTNPGSPSAYVAISNDNVSLPPVFSISVGTAIITPSAVNGGNTGTTFALPNLNGGTPKYQMRYINNFMYNPSQAPTFRWDSGWTQWGTIPAGTTGVAGQYFFLPVTQFGLDVAATDVFTELYIQNQAGTIIRLIDNQPIYTVAARYGYQVSKETGTPNNIKIEFADGGLAYHSYGVGFVAIDATWTYRLYVYKTEKYNKFYDHTGDTKLNQLWSLGFIDITSPYTVQGAGYFDRSVTQPSHTTRLNYDGNLYATNLYTTNNVIVSGTGGISVFTATTTGVTINPASGTPLTIKNTDQTTTTVSVTSVGLVTATGASSGFRTLTNGTLDIAGTTTLRGATTVIAATTLKPSSGIPLTVRDAGDTTDKLTIASSGSLDTYGNLSTHVGSGGTLNIDGGSTFTGTITANGISTFNTSVIIDDSLTIKAATVTKMTIDTNGNLSTVGNLETTGSGTLTIAGISTFTGALTANGGINVNTVGTLNSTVATFNLLATPTTINIGANNSDMTIGNSASTGTVTIKAATFNIPASSPVINSGILTLGDATHVGNLKLSQGSTGPTYATITNASGYLTITQPDANSYISFRTTSSTERFKISYDAVSVISSIPFNAYSGVFTSTVSATTYTATSGGTSTLSGTALSTTSVTATTITAPTYTAASAAAMTVRSVNANLTVQTTTAGTLALASVGALTIKDQYLTSGVAISQSGTTALSGFVTATSVVAALNEIKGDNYVAGVDSVGAVKYNGTTVAVAAGTFNGKGSTDPSNTTRLNYEGNLYATTFYGNLAKTSGVSLTIQTTSAGLTIQTVTSGSLTLTGVSGISLASSSGSITFDDTYLSSPVSISQSGTTTLLGFDSATSIVGALNEVKKDNYTAGSTFVGAVKYNGTSIAAGTFNGHGSTSPTNSTRLNYEGYLYATAFLTSSERKLKNNIQKFEERATDILSSIDVVSFNYKSDPAKEKKIGFIADDTHEYLTGTSHKNMDINNAIGLLIKAVQELKNDISMMKGYC